jgi:hypothetical protein
VQAQGANEALFIGTSVAGTTDPYWVYEPNTGALLTNGGSVTSNNCSGSRFLNGGTEIALASSLGNQITKGNATNPALTFTVLTPLSGASYGIQEDHLNQRIWTLSDQAGSYELRVIDNNPSSPTFGNILGSTTGAAVGIVESWALAPNKKVAVVPGLVFNGVMAIVDTDPASPTYLQVDYSNSVGGIPGSYFALDTAISSDSRWVVAVLAGTGGTLLPRYDLQNRVWVDTNPTSAGIQHVFLAQPNASKIEFVPGSDSVICGGLGLGVNGWIGRADLSTSAPANWTFTEFAAGQGLLEKASGIAVSPSGLHCSATAQNPARVHIFEVATGNLTRTINVTPSTAINMYESVWRGSLDAGVAFCFGDGSTGVLCPCSNPSSGPQRGCDNSFATGGARLLSTGIAQVGTDTLVFNTLQQAPNGTTILLQGTTQLANAAPFGMGLRCVGGSLKRLYVKSPGGTGGIVAPTGTDLSVSDRSAALGDAIVAGQHRYYMAYYRDPVVVGGCSALSTFNATNAMDVTW